MFDTLIVFLEEFFEKTDFEKNQQTTQKHAKLPSMQRVNIDGFVWKDSEICLKIHVPRLFYNFSNMVLS